MLRSRLARTSYATLVFLTMAVTPAFADSSSCASLAGSDTVDTYLKAILNWLTGTPFKVICAIAIICMVALLALDGGNLSQVAKTFVVILLIVFGALMIVSIIMGASATCY